jgi:hypothetical protein
MKGIFIDIKAKAILIFILILIVAGCAEKRTVINRIYPDYMPARSKSEQSYSDYRFMRNHRGANEVAIYAPKYVLEEANQYRVWFMKQNSYAAVDLRYQFFYNQNGEGCLLYTVIPKSGYSWPSNTWVGRIWENEVRCIGKGTCYTITRENYDEAEARLEERRKDPVFREIEKIILQIATEYDYDYGKYDGSRVKYKTPDVKKALCEGYSDAVYYRLSRHPLVKRVETCLGCVSAGNGHAWNTIVLKDGRKLYCDATWYDGNSIDANGYVDHVPRQNPVDLTFDIDEFNSLGGAIDNATGRLLKVHFACRDVKLKVR